MAVHLKVVRWKKVGNEYPTTLSYYLLLAQDEDEKCQDPCKEAH